MKQIAIINPNIATVHQDSLGLSPFGLLSRLFTQELAGRVHQEEGMWQPLALALLEDPENEESREMPPAPEIHLNLDLKIITKALREEFARQSEREPKEKKGREKTPPVRTTEQRVLERILLRERELRIREANISRLLTVRQEFFLIGQPGTRAPSYRPVTAELATPGKVRSMARAGAEYRAARSSFPLSAAFDRPFSGVVPAEIAPLMRREGAALSPASVTGDTAGGAKNVLQALPGRFAGQGTPAPHRQQDTAAQTISTLARLYAQKQSRPAQGKAERTLPGAAAEGTAAFPGVVEGIPILHPNLVLASQTTTTPAGDGWAPQWLPEHPGYTAEKPEHAEAPGGSILFPDLLRYRREQAISGNTLPEESRVPAALSATLKRAANRERTAPTVPAELSDGQGVREQAARREALSGNTQGSVAQHREKQRTEEQNAPSGASAVLQPVTERRTAEEQQHAAKVPAETAQEQTARAVPAAGSAVPAPYDAPAGLEYKAREQADREPEQPSGQRRAEQQSAMQSASASTQPVTEGGTTAAQQHQYTAKAPAETARARTAQQSDHVDTSAETMQEQTARAVPVTGSAVPAPYDAPGGLEYKAREQADREREQPSG
ncbi:MAG: hypothetical protein IJ617_05570, partial [Oscillospiraceae bacterium]|nr:hypothetical protein [Oscillospiraceae bacterium]